MCWNFMGHAYEFVLIVQYNPSGFLSWTRCVVYMINSKDFHLSGRVLQVIFINFHVGVEITYLHIFLLPYRWTEIEGSKLNPISAAIEMFRDGSSLIPKELKKLCPHFVDKNKQCCGFSTYWASQIHPFWHKTVQLSNFFCTFNWIKLLVDHINAYGIA